MRSLGMLQALTEGSLTYEPEPWQLDLLHKVLPAGWRKIQHHVAGTAFLSGDGLVVIPTALIEDDGKRWQHVSLSRPNRLPSWDDIRRVKDIFIGRDKLAIQVLPPPSKYVNIHPHCLHLWHCLDGDPVPDFRKMGMI